MQVGNKFSGTQGRLCHLYELDPVGLQCDHWYADWSSAGNARLPLSRVYL